MATLEVHLVNSTTSSDVYAFVTGHDIDNGNQWLLIEADGHTVYHPSSPASQSPLARDCAIHLGAPGSSKTVRIPHMAGGRIYFSVSRKLQFFINPGPALVEPSVTNPADSNHNLLWGFCEFTWNKDQIYANISYVDFVSIPIGIKVTGASGKTKSVKGLPHGGLHRVAEGLWDQSKVDGHPWRDLIHRDPNEFHKIYRCLSPNQGMVQSSGFLAGYYDPYVNSVWSHYSSRDMTIDLQNAAGANNPTARGRVSGGNLVLNGQAFGRPSTSDIFSANAGPFTTGGDALRNAIIPRLNAEFNRSTLLKTDHFPAPEKDYYHETITNHYARIVHSVTDDGRGYASPYDDVTPTGGKDQSGFVNDGAPKLFTVTVGGFAATSQGSSKMAVVQGDGAQVPLQDESAPDAAGNTAAGAAGAPAAEPAAETAAATGGATPSATPAATTEPATTTTATTDTPAPAAAASTTATTDAYAAAPQPKEGKKVGLFRKLTKRIKKLSSSDARDAS